MLATTHHLSLQWYGRLGVLEKGEVAAVEGTWKVFVECWLHEERERCIDWSGV